MLCYRVGAWVCYVTVLGCGCHVTVLGCGYVMSVRQSVDMSSKSGRVQTCHVGHVESRRVMLVM